MNKAYIKQLEDENEALKKRLEVADLKGECYDYIMSRSVMESNHGFVTKSEIHPNGLLVIFARVRKDTKSIAYMKICNDMIEDERAYQGHNRK